VKEFRKYFSLFFAISAIIFCCALFTTAQTTLPLLNSYNGRYNVITTGGTLRSQSNTNNPCSRNTNSTAALSGLPATATVVKAYLYWAGSGQTADNTITFDGTNYTADRTFSTVYNLSPNNFYYFGAVEDVTSKVQSRRNANYTFQNLNFQTADVTGQPYCSQQAVMGGWGLYVIYQDASETPKRVNLYEGFEVFRNSSRSFTLNGLNVPTTPSGKMSVLTWEGDPSLSGGGENFTFNGNSFVDALNPLGNVYNSTINTLNNSASYGVDLDTFDIGAFLNPGDTSGTATVTSGSDLVLLNTVAISAATTVADLELTKTANNSVFSEGQTVTYTLNLLNRGPSVANGTQVRDLLPNGLTFVSANTSNGTFNQSTGIWNVASVGVNATATLTINATVNAGTTGTNITNTAEVTLAGNFDPDSTENNGVTNEDDYSAATISIRPNADLVISKTAPSNVNLGQSISYTIDVTNAGTTNVSGITIADAVPSSVTVSGWTCTVTGTAVCGTASGTTSNINLNGSINAGAGNRIRIVVNGVANSAGTISNTATVTTPATFNESNPANNTSTATTIVGLSISGTIWQDSNGSAAGTFSNIRDGAEVGTNGGNLFVYAVNNAGNVIGSASVNANGTYQINGIQANLSAITLRLSTLSVAVGQTAPTANVPTGWTNTSPLATASFNTTSVNLNGRDFGIERLPNAVGGQASSQPNPGANQSVAVQSNLFSGTDPDGVISTFEFLTFPANIDSFNINGTTYNSQNFPSNGVSINADANGNFPLNLITIDPVDGVVTVTIPFYVRDNAGKRSIASADAAIPFSNSLPPNVSLVKRCTQPANCENANQLPGTDVTYSIAFTNTGGQSAHGLSILDAIPQNTELKLSSVNAVLPAGMTILTEYSYDFDVGNPSLASWTNAPPPDNGTGYNPTVKAIRWRSLSGSLGIVQPNNTGSVSFTVKIK